LFVSESYCRGSFFDCEDSLAVPWLRHKIASARRKYRVERCAREAGNKGLASDQPVDLLIVGGGVNGTGIARDAADRGLKVLLCEQDDLAQHTSSASSKLIHGGLRYLEHYEFRLVREALIEREVLLRLAPHIIWPLCFILPHSPEQRPAWMIRLGLLLYDYLGGRAKLPGSARIDLCSTTIRTAPPPWYATRPRSSRSIMPSSSASRASSRICGPGS
jgi:hypothetical protein